MKKLVLMLSLVVLASPAFANVHLLTRSAKLGYKAAKYPAKAVYAAGKFTAKQLI
jgi:hypothetical protein